MQLLGTHFGAATENAVLFRETELLLQETNERNAEVPLPIFVGDDNATNRKLCSAMLGKLGFEPLVVGSGAEAIEAVRLALSDAVLMSFEMPKMNRPRGYRQGRRGVQGRDRP